VGAGQRWSLFAFPFLLATGLAAALIAVRTAKFALFMMDNFC